jgi:hypothetical protein
MIGGEKENKYDRRRKRVSLIEIHTKISWAVEILFGSHN